MAVMSAGMHDTRILAAKCKPGVFFDRKCIDICTEGDCLAARGGFSPFDYCPETIVIRVIMWRKSHFFEALSNLMRCIFFFERKLWMRMKITPLLDDPVFVLFCDISKVHGVFLSVLSI